MKRSRERGVVIYHSRASKRKREAPAALLIFEKVPAPPSYMEEGSGCLVAAPEE